MDIGFVGLGVMGSRIAKRLMDAGHSLHGWNRTKDKAAELLQAGMHWAETPRAAAERAEIVFSMVADTQSAVSITQGENGIIAGLGPGKVYIDMTTQSPIYVQHLAQQAAEAGAAMLDVPVSGSVVTVESGQLAMMVGGDEAVLERVRPVLLAIGPTITYVGPSGQAMAAKVALNMTIAVQLAAFNEYMMLCEKSGIPRGVAIQVFTNSAVASPVIKYKAPVVESRSEAFAWFNNWMLRKDLVLAEELSRDVQVPIFMGSAAQQYITATLALGLGEKDFAYMFDAVANLANVDPNKQ